MATSEIINVLEDVRLDDTMTKYQYHSYLPENNVAINSAGQITIRVDATQEITHPSESFLEFTGRLTKATGDAYTDADLVTMVNNGLMYLFNQITLYIGDTQIELINNPGQITTMLKTLTVSDDYSRTKGLDSLWVKDSSDAAALANTGFNSRHGWIIRTADPKGYFQVSVPLKEIFGFHEDYTKIMFGLRQRLVLVRKADDDAIFKAAAADAGKITLDSIKWFVPHVELAIEEETKRLALVANKTTLIAPFRARRTEVIDVAERTNFRYKLSSQMGNEKPRFVLVGFQTDRDGSQDVNSSIFDNLNVKRMKVTLNGIQYPNTEYDLNISQNQFSRAYQDTAKFRAAYTGLTSELAHANVDPIEWKGLYPIYAFDLTKQSTTVDTDTINLEVEAEFRENAPANTRAYFLIVSDKTLSFKSNGNDFIVLSE